MTFGNRNVCAEVTHRPWPLPRRPWIMAMNWEQLAFLHWPVPAAALRPLIPAPLSLDTFQGTAWLGVVPFLMTGVRPRCVPALPWFSRFCELNLRTYVTYGEKPGVWFFSLDAANPMAVRAARRSFGLPYFDARMNLQQQERWIEYESIRTHRAAPPAVFRGRYRSDGELDAACPGQIEYFLTERYCLYTVDRRGRVCCGEVHHRPWPLQRGIVEIETNTVSQSLGIELDSRPPLVHFARRLDVVAWGPEPIHES